MTAPEAFLLLALPNASLDVGGQHYSGQLNLQCVTMPLPDSFAKSSPDPSSNRDVYLILWIGGQEIALDPAKIVHREDGPTWRTYHFSRTAFDPMEMTLKLFPPVSASANTQLAEDMETFHGILAQYADVRMVGAAAAPQQPPGYGVDGDQKSRAAVAVDGPLPPPATGSAFPVAYPTYSAPSPGHAAHLPPDLRGHVIMVNEDTGEIIGELDHKVRLHEDPNLRVTGHEGDAVIIEVPDDRTGADQDATSMEMFVRAIPPEQQDWMTKSATIVSHVISTTTNLLLTTITATSSYYISHSTPYTPPNSRATPPRHSEKGTPLPNQPGQPAQPSKAMLLLTSETTRRNLASVHAVSGKAVQVSGKTISVIDDMIRRAIGGKQKGKSPQPPLPPRAPQQSSYPTSPPPGTYGYPSYPTAPQAVPYGASPYSPYSSPPPQVPGSWCSTAQVNEKYLGPMPARGPSSIPPPLPPRAGPSPPGVIAAPQPVPGTNYQGQPLKIGTKAKILLSADLILSTLDDSSRRLLNRGTETVGNVVGHKYGPEARETSMLAAGTARNVGLVYVDMTGIGRRALLKRAGKQYIKANFSSGQPHKVEDLRAHQQQQQQLQSPPPVPPRPNSAPYPSSYAPPPSSQAPPAPYPNNPPPYDNNSAWK